MSRGTTHQVSVRPMFFFYLLHRAFALSTLAGRRVCCYNQKGRSRICMLILTLRLLVAKGSAWSLLEEGAGPTGTWENGGRVQQELQ